MTPAMIVATMGGVGRLHPGPGSWASALVLPLALAGPLPCLLAATLLTFAGLWAAPRVLGAGDDPGWFVADEAAGMALALAALQDASLAGVALAFALFRLFDIAKPWPVSWADRQPGAFGVMADDLIAGAAAGALLIAAQLAGLI
jgi:phosphatidylglycerophosphatase A